MKAVTLVGELNEQEAFNLFPQEYDSMLESFEHGEAVLHVQKDEREADTFYLLTLQKGGVLRQEILRHNQAVEQNRLRIAAEEAARAEEERLFTEAAEAERKLIEQEKMRQQQEAAAQAAHKDTGAGQKVPQPPQPPPINSYTVRRGETLPQIAARPEIYNNSSLWPLIYRANRDQVRNPTQLWPGQVLKIPRKFSRSDADGARRFSDRNQ